MTSHDHATLQCMLTDIIAAFPALAKEHDLREPHINQAAPQEVRKLQRAWHEGVREVFAKECMEIHTALSPWIEKRDTLRNAEIDGADALARAQHHLWKNEQHPSENGKQSAKQRRGDVIVAHITEHAIELQRIALKRVEATPEHILPDIIEEIRQHAQTVFRWKTCAMHALDTALSVEDADTCVDPLKNNSLSFDALLKFDEAKIRLSSHRKEKLSVQQTSQRPTLISSPQERKKFQRLRAEHNAPSVSFPAQPSPQQEGIDISFAEPAGDICPAHFHFPIFAGETLHCIPGVQEITDRTMKAILEAQTSAEKTKDALVWCDAMSAAEQHATRTDRELRSLHVPTLQLCAIIERILRRLESMSNSTPNMTMMNCVQKQWLLARLQEQLHPHSGKSAFLEIADEKPLQSTIEIELQWRLSRSPNTRQITLYLSGIREICQTFDFQKQYVQRLANLGAYCGQSRESLRHLHAIDLKTCRRGQAIWNNHFSCTLPKVPPAQRAALYAESAKALLVLSQKQSSVLAASLCETAARTAAWEAGKIFHAIQTPS